MNKAIHPTAVTPDDLDQALAKARDNYLTKRPQCAATFETSTAYMPGGNTRSVLFHGPVPLRIVSGDGARIRDADGLEYTNLLGEYTAGLFGHNHPVIRRAIDDALDKGLSLSGHNPNEITLSKLVCQRFPAIDKVRFTNSGTEANLMAVSIARIFTGRKKIMVFHGGYHGGLLFFKTGNVAVNAPFDYVIADYNDIDGAKAAIHHNKDDLACVLMEPMQGSSGCIPADHAFLQMIREETRQAGIVMIYDEVMTSRLSPQGHQGISGVIPDMTTLGKYVGGGMSFGAFGGNEEIMAMLDPRRSDAIPHAGTFNNNTLTMAAGAAAMGEVLTDENLGALNERGERLRAALNKIARKYQTCVQFTGIGSLMALHTSTNEIRNVHDLKNGDDRILELLFLDLLEQGYYIARRGFISLMLPLGDGDIDGFIEVFETIIQNRAALMRA